MPRTGITIYPNYKAPLVLGLMKGNTGLFRKVIRLAVGRASVCLDCGLVMWACGGSELERLRAHKAALIPG